MKTAGDVMSRDPITVRLETTVEELARVFTERRIGMAPVVDAAGDLVGVVTETDLVEQNCTLHIPTVFALMDSVFMLGTTRHFERDLARLTARTVGEICTRHPRSVTPGAALDEVADLMVSHRYTGVPVVEGRKVVGVVARVDLIRTMLVEPAARPSP
jgi:CBS domain-containing protein